MQVIPCVISLKAIPKSRDTNFSMQKFSQAACRGRRESVLLDVATSKHIECAERQRPTSSGLAPLRTHQPEHVMA
jgi:hypothetical protein